VAIVAHSYGGVVTTRTAAEFTDITKKTFAVAFTDSVHYRVKSTNQKMFNKWMELPIKSFRYLRAWTTLYLQKKITWFGHGSADKALILRILKHKCWVLMVLMVDERWSELCADG
jgi:pimeloyl-ACP methyl ester carboxylesterase